MQKYSLAEFALQIIHFHEKNKTSFSMCICFTTVLQLDTFFRSFSLSAVIDM